MANRRRQPQGKPGVEWDFFSFPTFVAFMFGVFITSFLISIEVGGYIGLFHLVFSVGSLFAVSWSLTRVVSRHLSNRRVQRRREREEEEERERRALAARAARAAESGEAFEPQRRRKRRRRP